MDLIEDPIPPKILIEWIEGELSKDKEQIEELNHVHIVKIKNLIKSPINFKMRINIFLRELERVNKRDIESLIYKDQLQIEHAQYQNIVDLLDVFSKWQSSLRKY